MNRIILFRGLTASNEWVEGDLIKGMGAKHGKMYILPHVVNVAYLKGCDPIDGYNVKPESIGQFTGLHDKHGKRIFEGDVVWCDKATEPEEKGFICSFENYQWKFKNVNFQFDEDYNANNESGFEYISKKTEIIGNIHTNPELLQP